MAAAASHRGIFHFCLHPENLTESPDGFSMFEDMLDQLTRARDRGDVEVLTMTEVVTRMERGRGKETPSRVIEMPSRRSPECAQARREVISRLAHGSGARMPSRQGHF
jgi:hypothetical protein